LNRHDGVADAWAGRQCDDQLHEMLLASDVTSGALLDDRPPSVRRLRGSAGWFERPSRQEHRLLLTFATPSASPSGQAQSGKAQSPWTDEGTE
jgi:hypothetical protein